MFTRIHPKNVHEMSSKKCPRKVTQKEDISWTFLSTKCRQKCPRDVTPFVHEMSPIMSTKCLPPIILTMLIYAKLVFFFLRVSHCASALLRPLPTLAHPLYSLPSPLSLRFHEIDSFIVIGRDLVATDHCALVKVSQL